MTQASVEQGLRQVRDVLVRHDVYIHDRGQPINSAGSRSHQNEQAAILSAIRSPSGGWWLVLAGIGRSRGVPAGICNSKVRYACGKGAARKPISGGRADAKLRSDSA